MMKRALLAGLVGLAAAPVIAFFGVLLLARAMGGCGPGDAGGCEMGAAAFALASIVPGFFIFAAISVIRDLVRKPS